MVSKYIEIRKKMKELSKPGNANRLPIIFVTFDRTLSKELVKLIHDGTLNYKLGGSEYGRAEEEVNIDVPDEPEAVIWTDLGYSKSQRIGRIFITSVITLIVLGIL